jgi:hypothetical protein
MTLLCAQTIPLSEWPASQRLVPRPDGPGYSPELLIRFFRRWRDGGNALFLDQRVERNQIFRL